MKFLNITFLVLLSSTGFTQIPVGPVVDNKLVASNTTISLAETATNFLLKKELPFQKEIKDIQDFFHKAQTIVNHSIQNMRLIRHIIETHADIIAIYSRAIERLNQPFDEDGDGVDDLDFLDKWKHSQALLALSKEAASVFELFTLILQKDAFSLNDRGRVLFLEKAYQDIRGIKFAMRTQLRRINRDIYSYQRQRRQLKVYSGLFEKK